MPIPFVLRKSKQDGDEHSKQKGQGEALVSAQAQPQLQSGSGVIMYTFDAQANTVEGWFVLAQYGGALARETGTKCEGTPGQLAGVYDIVTYTPTNDVFATGKLILFPVGTAGAYSVTYKLLPTPENLEFLGFTPGTKLIYDAIGYLLPDGIHLTAAWDNDLYVRRISADTAEWGYRLFKIT